MSIVLSLVALFWPLLLLYFIPSFVAWKRKHVQLKAIMVLNILLGGRYLVGLDRLSGLSWNPNNRKKHKRIICS